MAKSKSYQNNLIESLKDPTEAAEYLNAALEDGETEVFLLALRDVVDFVRRNGQAGGLYFA